MIKCKVMRFDGRRAHCTLGRGPHLELRRKLQRIWVPQLYAYAVVPRRPHTRIHTHIATQLLDLVVQTAAQCFSVSKPHLQGAHTLRRCGHFRRERCGACIGRCKQRLQLRHTRSQRVVRGARLLTQLGVVRRLGTERIDLKFLCMQPRMKRLRLALVLSPQ